MNEVFKVEGDKLIVNLKRMNELVNEAIKESALGREEDYIFKYKNNYYRVRIEGVKNVRFLM